MSHSSLHEFQLVRWKLHSQLTAVVGEITYIGTCYRFYQKIHAIDPHVTRHWPRQPVQDLYLFILLVI